LFVDPEINDIVRLFFTVFSGFAIGAWAMYLHIKKHNKIIPKGHVRKFLTIVKE